MTDAGKSRRVRKPKRTVTTVASEAKPRDEKGIAKLCLMPIFQAADTIRRYGRIADSNLDLSGLVEGLAEQVEAVRGGNLARGEDMLISQAHTLDAIFNSCATQATKVKVLNQYDTYLRLALKAQSQCRTTWETLAEIKNPRSVAFVRQANVTTGPQQVNNGPLPEQGSRARETVNEPSKVLEATNGERLDQGAAGAAGRTDTLLETVGTIHRTKDNRG